MVTLRIEDLTLMVESISSDGTWQNIKSQIKQQYPYHKILSPLTDHEGQFKTKQRNPFRVHLNEI